MDLTALFREIIAFVATPHAVAAFSVIVNIVLWRAYQSETKSKDELYDRYLTTTVEIVGDYHDFAHTLDDYVRHHEQAREASKGVDTGGGGAQEGS